MPTDFLTLTRAVSRPRRPSWRDTAPQPCLLPDSIALTDERTSLPDDKRYEPALAASPFLVEFEELDRLDPDRTEISPDAPPASPSTRPIRGPIGSLLIHLLALSVILAPGLNPPELPTAVPIQLVLETPPPPAPAIPAPPEPPGRLASEDVGDVSTKSGQAPAGVAEETATPPAPTPTLIPPPPPEKPLPPKEQVAALATPKVPPPILQKPTPAAATPVPHRPANEPHLAARPAHVPGPSATRDEYLAYLVSLTKQHTDLLPLTLIGDRRGETSLAVLVLADGTIARISVAQGSGYPEIDNKIEQMVAAVRHFPPLPQWYQGERMELIFKLKFPEGLEQR